MMGVMLLSSRGAGGGDYEAAPARTTTRPAAGPAPSGPEDDLGVSDDDVPF